MGLRQSIHETRCDEIDMSPIASLTKRNTPRIVTPDDGSIASVVRYPSLYPHPASVLVESPAFTNAGEPRQEQEAGKAQNKTLRNFRSDSNRSAKV